MKPHLFIIISCIILLSSCKSDTEEVQLDAALQQTEEVQKLPYAFDTLRGIYVGDFGGSDIRVVLNYLNENRVVGYNIHKGLQRNLLGTVKELENEVKLILEEPGDNPYDGVFTVSIDKRTFKMTGTWESVSGKISKKSFKLSKQNRVDIDDIDWMKIQLTSNNFTDYISSIADSLGTIYFAENGLATYEYYPLTSSEDKSQMVQIKGSWTVRGDEVTIMWQENPIFPSRKSLLYIQRSEDYLEGLKMDGRMMYNIMY